MTRVRVAALALLAAAMLASSVHAARPRSASGSTYFVREDGGTAAQCTGQKDAPYKGRDRACAWKHPFFALPPGGPSRIAGGDTLIIAPGRYVIGLGAPGADNGKVCHAEWAYDCRMPPIPSGPSADKPTRILGKGSEHCAKPPTLSGTERVGSVLNLDGSSNVEIGCLDITDHSDCIEFHCHGASCPAAEVSMCERDKAPFGEWAASGIHAADSKHVRLFDLDIHGLAHTGIQAGRIADWTLERVKLRMNGWVGWDGDLGDKGSSNSGTLTFRDVEIAWNGCGERVATGAPFGCWAQQNGGYGDGLGTAKTGGNWVFDNVRVHDNTSDGLDLLYADGTGKISVRGLRAWGNAGNQVKLTGSAEVRDSVLIGTCAAREGQFAMTSGDLCRADGNPLVFNVGPKQHALAERNDVRSEGACVLELDCAAAGCRDSGNVRISGNTLSALATTRAQTRAPCVAWLQPELRGADVRFADNRLRGLKLPPCPLGSKECTNPVWLDATPPWPRDVPEQAAGK